MRRIAIIGGGIAGLSAAYELTRLAVAGVPVEAVVFEASTRFGGIVETTREGGFTVECGPDGWVSAKPWARELAIELGLEDDLIGSKDETRKTHILLSGRLVAMPDGMTMMVPSDLAALDGSPLFSDAAKAAYRAELDRADELRSSIPDHDESVADFVLRHFGPEVLDRVAAPLLSGVFGGDVRKLSVRAVMPTFMPMEREYGSLIAALQAAQKQAAQKQAARSQPATGNRQPATIFTSLRHGLGSLIDRLVAAIPSGWLRLNTTVTAITPPTPTRSTWTVAFRNHGGAQRQASESFDAVFLATSLDATRHLLGQLDASSAALLPTESSSAVLVAFCYPDASRVPVPPGFGFLVPPNPITPDPGPGPSSDSPSTPASLLLACTFIDQKFPHRVPPGGRILRAFFGGAAADRLARCGNDEIAAIARLELARILNSAVPISAAAPTPAPVPALTVVRRWPNSLPQYAVGHLDRIALLESRLSALPGLTLLGNALHGVGLPDLIRDARAAARAQGVGCRE